MTEVIQAEHPEVMAEWVASRIPHVDNFGPCNAFAVVNNDRILAGVIFHDYQKMYDSIQLSMAADSPMWAKRPVIASLLSYAFDFLGCYRLFTLIPIDNKMAIKVNSHIGLTQESVCHSGFGKNRHAVVMRMLAPVYHKLYVSS